MVGGCLGSEALRMEQPAAIYRWSTEGVLRIAVSDSLLLLVLSLTACLYVCAQVPHFFSPFMKLKPEEPAEKILPKLFKTAADF